MIKSLKENAEIAITQSVLLGKHAWDVFISPRSYRNPEQFFPISIVLFIGLAGLALMPIRYQLEFLTPSIVRIGDEWLIMHELASDHARLATSAGLLGTFAYLNNLWGLVLMTLYSIAMIWVLDRSQAKLTGFWGLFQRLAIPSCVAYVLIFLISLLIFEVAREERAPNWLFFVIGATLLVALIYSYLGLLPLVIHSITRQPWWMIFLVYLYGHITLAPLLFSMNPVEYARTALTDTASMVRAAELATKTFKYLKADDLENARIVAADAIKERPHDLRAQVAMLQVYTLEWLRWKRDGKMPISPDQVLARSVLLDELARTHAGDPSAQLYLGNYLLVVGECARAGVAFRLANRLTRQPFERVQSLWFLLGLNPSDDHIRNTLTISVWSPHEDAGGLSKIQTVRAFAALPPSLLHKAFQLSAQGRKQTMDSVTPFNSPRNRADYERARRLCGEWSPVPS